MARIFVLEGGAKLVLPNDEVFVTVHPGPPAQGLGEDMILSFERHELADLERAVAKMNAAERV